MDNLYRFTPVYQMMFKFLFRRKRSEDFRQLMEQASDAILIANSDNVYIDVNDAACRMLGYSREELAGMSILDVIDSAELPRLQQVKEDLRLGCSRIDEWSMRRKDGSFFAAEVSTRILNDGRCQAIIRDITERKESEIRLRESEERFRYLADHAPVLVWMTDSDKNGCFFSKTWLDYTGRSLEEESGFGWLASVHPDDMKILEKCDLSFRRRERFEIEFRLRRHDGQYRWMLDTGVPGFDGNGKFLGFIGTCTDITDRRKEEEVRTFMAAIVESSDDAIITKGPDGRIRSWNRSAEALFGYSAEEIIGKPIHVIIPPDRLGEEDFIVEKLRTGEKIAHYETVRKRRDGTLVDLSISVSPLRDRDGNFIGAAKIARDIGRQKETKQQLIVAKEQAEAATKAKSEFLANISHEIRTPMNAVIGITEILLRKGNLSKEQEELLNTLLSSASHLLELINGILDYSRIEQNGLPLEKDDFDLRALLSECVDMVRVKAEEKNIVFSLCYADHLPVFFEGDVLRIRQVMMNLLGNAVKFTPEGKIAITADGEPLGHGLNVAISIADTGIGIPAVLIPSIFDKFTQVDSALTRTHGGSGLGLAITKALVELMGGTIAVESEPGEGSCFTVRIPLQPARSARTTEGPDPAPHTAKPCRVLVVEDHLPNVLVAKTFLSELACDVTVASSGHEALAHLESGPPFSMVLMDIQMPGMDGFETTRKIRELEKRWRRPATPIIAVTGHASTEDRELCRAAGMQGFLAKPYRLKELDEIIEAFYQPGP